MEGVLSSWASGLIFEDPFIQKLIVVIIFGLGFSQAFKLFHGYVEQLKGKKEKAFVDQEKGKWKRAVENLTESVDKMSRTMKIHDEKEIQANEEIHWLYEAHHQFDEDKVPVWYVRKSLETSIKQLAESIDKQTEFFNGIHQKQTETLRDIKSIREELHRRN